MTSRRIISSEKTILDKDDDNDVQSPGAPSSSSSSIAPAVPTDVIVKLLGFTLAMITVPIGSYFLTVNTLFKGNTTYAGGLAAVMANVVLIGYVVVAMSEDQTEQLEARRKQGKKE